MTTKDCRSAGLSRACGECKHARANHPPGTKAPPIAPTVGSSGKCYQFVGVIRPVVRA